MKTTTFLCLSVLLALFCLGCGEATIVGDPTADGLFLPPSDGVSDTGALDVGTAGTCNGKCGDNLVAGGCSCAADCGQGSVPCCADYTQFCGDCLKEGGCCNSDAECVSSDPCQAGTCTNEGICSYAMSSNVCALGANCVQLGEAHPTETCTSCEAQAGGGAAFVQVAGKTACDDANACTENDQCNDHGQCLGKLIADCCTSDAFCNTLEPCSVAYCDLGTNTCKVKPAEACCDEGVCCDTNNGAVMIAGKQCGNDVIQSQYQCDGQNIERRQAYAGCNGTTADGCSSEPQFMAWGSWMVLQACPAGTQCTVNDVFSEPTCEEAPPVEECQSPSQCVAVQSPCSIAKCSQGICSYDSLPKGLKCGSVVLETTYQCQNGNVHSQSKYAACDGASLGCLGTAFYWSPWQLHQQCGSNQACIVTSPNVPGTCQAQCDPSKPCCGANGTYEPVGTPCSNIKVAAKYQCSSSNPGGAIEKKQGYAGCTGGGDQCSSVSMYVVYDDWQTITQCGPNETCKAANTPFDPGTCVSQGGVCSSNQTQACGNCGTQTCNPNGQWGPCTGEGVCVAGQVVQGDAAFCDVCSERSCTNQCQWADECVLSGKSKCEWNKGTNFQYCDAAKTEWQFCLKPEQWGGDHCNWAPCAPLP